jgi:S1-C subfamily serine protease
VFSIVRDGQALTQAVELARSPRTEREMKRFKEVNFEFTARDVSFFDKESEGWPEIMPGAVVVEVTRGGWAALGELEVNDLIQMVDGEPVADVAALEDKMKQRAAARPRYVVLKVLRGVHTRYLQLETSWNKP